MSHGTVLRDKRVLKWNVPADDQLHDIGAGAVVHVACQANPDVVQVWTEELNPTTSPRKQARIYGTGQPIPPLATHVGSVVTAEGVLVWHVYVEQLVEAQ